MRQNKLIIGICGASCSGKTTIAGAIYHRLLQYGANIISEDDYYYGFAKCNIIFDGKIDFDNPKAKDHTLLLDHLKRISNNQPFYKPLYDFVSHERKDIKEYVEPKKIIIIEGTNIFYNQQIASYFDYKIFIKVEPEILFFRRIERDVKERGRQREDIIKQYNSQVLPAYKKWVADFEYDCDSVFINNDANYNNKFIQTIDDIAKNIEKML